MHGPRGGPGHFGAWEHGSSRCGCGCECNCGCCGCGCGTFPRRFISRKEKQEKLEKYLDQLKKELAGVEEHIQELKSK